jgi:hypothetical protein
MNKTLFDEINNKAKSEYFKNIWESNGVFSDLVENSNKQNINTFEISQKLREKITKLLVDKKIVSKDDKFELENLHSFIPKSLKSYNFDTGVNSLSQAFYETDDEFQNLYLEFIKIIYTNFFNFPFYFQNTPTIRLHCPESIGSSHYPRYHCDIGYGHPPQEINLWLPLTSPYKEQKHGFRVMNFDNSKKILSKYNYDFNSFITDVIQNKDLNQQFHELAPQVGTIFGETLAFDSRSIHTGEALNFHTRVSIDVRIIPVASFERESYLFRGAGKMKSLYAPGDAYNEISSDFL